MKLIEHLPQYVQIAIDAILKAHPEYKTKEGAMGECVTASDLLLFKMDELNDWKAVDGCVYGEPVDCIIDGKPAREPHHWVYFQGNYNIDLTARQFDENEDCPKIWEHKYY